jgi:hypothetical protein
MVYKFACPVPCRRIIKVYANTEEDAIDKIIVAGAMSCRMANKRACEEGHHRMPSLPEDRLREIVRLSMETESVDEAPVTMNEKMTKTFEGVPYGASMR